MRKRLGVLLTGAAVVSGLLVTAPSPVAGQALSAQPFVAHGNATAVSVNLLQLGQTQTLNVQVANSAGAVFSQGLQPLANEFGQNVSPAGQAARNAYGRGVGLELGVATPAIQNVDANQLRLASLAEAFAPPPSPLVEQSVDIAIDPLLNAQAVTGRARATYDPNFCPVGRPLSFGFGSVANLGLVGTPALPLVQTSTAGREVSTATTIPYLIPNGDGTFGVVTENLVTVAPITIAGVGTIEVGGPFILRATATGKPGDPRNGITYSGNPVLTITPVGGVSPIILTLNDLLGDAGLNLPVNPLLNAAVATPPRALGSPPGSATPPVVDPAGTSSSGAVDVLRLQLLTIPGVLSGGDIGAGHMEAVATAPPGGVRCNLPVSKVAVPDPVPAGETFEFRISIPSDPALYTALYNCDLIGITATDTISVVEGNPRFEIVGASNGGTISGNTVTFANLGNYALGDPPIVLTIQVRVTGGSGRLRDVVDVRALLGNCRGGTTGESIITGRGVIDGSAGSVITGTFVLEGPNVGAGTLAATGGTPVPLWVGGGLLLGAVGLVRLRRRAATVKA